MRLSVPIGDGETTYTHLVRSRRLGGLGLGIDLNPDHSCNWRCVYCDVEELRDAKGPRIDVEQLEREVDAALAALAAGHAEGELRGVLVSGTGEPTLSFHLLPALESVARLLRERELGDLRLALVTNGSNVNSRKVREGLEHLAAAGGELWFKLDSATREGLQRINRSPSILRQVRENMRVACGLCPTWLQTTAVAIDGAPALDEREQAEYQSFLALQQRARVRPRGVQLLAPDRPSRQEDGSTVSAPPRAWFDAFADRLRSLELEVDIFV